MEVNQPLSYDGGWTWALAPNSYKLPFGYPWTLRKYTPNVKILFELCYGIREESKSGLVKEQQWPGLGRHGGWALQEKVSSSMHRDHRQDKGQRPEPMEAEIWWCQRLTSTWVNPPALESAQVPITTESEAGGSIWKAGGERWAKRH